MDLGTIQYNVNADTTGVDRAAESVENFGDKAKAAAVPVDNLGKTSKKASQDSKKFGDDASKASGGVQSFGSSAGRAGIQIEQFVGQVQGGQNAFLALSAQATDLGIVLGAPLLGVIVGLSSAIAGALLPSLFKSGDAAEEVAEKVQKLVKELSDLDDMQRQVVLTAQGYNVKTKADEYMALTKSVEDQRKELERLNAENGKSVFVSGATNVVGGLGATAGYVQIIDNTKLIAEATKELNIAEVNLLEKRKDLEKLQDPTGGIAAIKKLNKEIELIGLTGEELHKKTAAQLGYTDSLAIEYVALKLLEDTKKENIKLEEKRIEDADKAKKIEDDRVASIKRLNDAMARETALIGNSSKEAQVLYDITNGIIKAKGKESEVLLANARAWDAARKEQEDAARANQSFMDELDEFGWEKVFDEPKAKKTADNIEKMWERIDQSASDAWVNIYNGADDVFGGIKDIFIRTLAEMAHQALTKPIMLNIQGMMQGSGGSLLAGVGGAGIYAAAGAVAFAAIDSWNKKQEAEIAKLRAEYVQERQSTGTLLGEANKKSESIKESLDHLSSISEGLLGVNVEMLNALNDIKNGVGRASAIFGRSGVKAPEVGGLGTSTINKDLAGVALFGGFYGVSELIGGELGGFIDGVIGGVSKAIYSKSKKVIDSGIQFNAQTLADILTNGTIEAFTYATIQTKKKTLGVTTSNKTKTQLGELDEALTKQFSLVFSSAGDALESAAASFGKDFNDYADKFIIDTQKLSLKGLEGDELTAEIEAFFSSTLDSWAETLVGEQVLVQKELTEKQKWIEKVLGKEIFDRQSEMVNAGSAILDKFQKVGEGAFETVIRLAGELNVFNSYADALGINFNMLGYSAIEATQAIVEASGGFDKLQESLNVYYDKFFEDSEKIAKQSESLAKALGDLGVTSIPETRDAYRELINAQDLSTEAGQKQFAALLGYADAVDIYITALEKEKEARIDTAYSMLERSIDAEQKILDDQIGVINKSLDASRAVFGALESALSGMIISSNRTQQANRRQAQSSLENMLVASRGGSLPNIDDLNNALSVISQPSENLYSTFEDYATDFYKTAGVIKDLQNITGDQISTEELALSELEKQSSFLGEISEWAKQQIDELNGIDTSIVSLSTAMNNLSAILGVQIPTYEQLKMSVIKPSAMTTEEFAAKNTELIKSQQDINKKHAEVMESAQVSLVDITNKFNKIIQKWDKEGLPQERVY